MALSPGHDFNFTTDDAFVISVVFNLGCVFFLLLYKFLTICQKARENRESIKECQDTLQKQRVLITTAFRITQQLLMLTTMILGCVSLRESKVLVYPFYFPNAYTIPEILKLTLNINIGRYFFLSFGNLVMSRDSKFPALIIHHFVTLCTYIVISAYQQNMFLGICGIFTELSTTPVTISRILRDTNVHAKNMNRYYMLIIAGCDLTLLFRGIFPIICLTLACYTQNPFGMKGFPLVVFFMSVCFFGIINIWMIVQAFYTYSQTQEKRKTLSTQSLPNSPSLSPRPSFYTFPQFGALVDSILSARKGKDLLKSTQTDEKKIVFENNLSSKAAQLSEKKVNISSNAKQNSQNTTIQNVQIGDQADNRNSNIPQEHVVNFAQFAQFINQ